MRTDRLWGVLAVLLTVGTIGGAFAVYGVSGSLDGRSWPDLPIAISGGLVAGFALLLLTGLLYRVDRLLGVPHREVRLFE